jgi:hypothetical protein
MWLDDYGAGQSRNGLAEPKFAVLWIRLDLHGRVDGRPSAIIRSASRGMGSVAIAASFTCFSAWARYSSGSISGLSVSRNVISICRLI